MDVTTKGYQRKPAKSKRIQISKNKGEPALTAKVVLPRLSRKL
jgi:hypothetical protein